MDDTRTQPLQEPGPEQRGTIVFPNGLIGFEQAKEYVLLGSPEEAPFLWLQMVDEPKLSFLVVAPHGLVEDYNPEISEADVEFLGLKTPEDAWLLNIVTLHADGRATVNLKGPIVINRHTLVAKQVVPVNAPELPLQHPLAATPVQAT